MQRREAAPVHVIAYQPPGRRTRRHFPVGCWNLQELAAWKAGIPVPGGDWSIEAPREASTARLAAFARDQLGYPVILEPALAAPRPGRLPFTAQAPELVCYATRDRARHDGPDVLNASVYGDGIPALKEAALAVAGKLYGRDALLQVERVGSIDSSSSSRGSFFTEIRVRCLNFSEDIR